MGRGDSMKFNEMTIEQLKVYRASVEAYGTASVIDGTLDETLTYLSHQIKAVRIR